MVRIPLYCLTKTDQVEFKRFQDTIIQYRNSCRRCLLLLLINLNLAKCKINNYLFIWNKTIIYICLYFTGINPSIRRTSGLPRGIAGVASSAVSIELVVATGGLSAPLYNVIINSKQTNFELITKQPHLPSSSPQSSQDLLSSDNSWVIYSISGRSFCRRVSWRPFMLRKKQHVKLW